MNIKLSPRVLFADKYSAQFLRAIMFAVFEDYLAATSVEEFQQRFGTFGTESLAQWCLPILPGRED